jgi:D-inositol-3-phosphate glycosyltransferase
MEYCLARGEYLISIVGREVRRIGVLSVHASPLAALGAGSNGGLNVYVREVCRAFGSLGVATDVFTRVPAGEPVRVEPLGDLGRVIDIPAGGRDLDRYQQLSVIPEFASAVRGRVRAADYDLLYSHYWLSGVAASILSAELCLPWAHTAHTWAVVKNLRLAPGATPEPERRGRIECEIARAADLLVVSTADERRILADTYGVEDDRVAVIMPGVDLDTFHLRRKQAARRALGRTDQRLFAVVGRLERLKGVDLAIRAVAELAEDHPEARLLVIGGDGGEPGEADRLRGLVAELGLERQVEFCGPLPQSRLSLVYAASDACLLPSYTESFGLVGLEAEACGTPVIASQAAGLAAVVRDGETGFLVASGDAHAFAGAMRALLGDRHLAERMGTLAAEQAAGFSWRHVAENLLDRFSTLADDRHPEQDDRLAL